MGGRRLFLLKLVRKMVNTVCVWCEGGLLCVFGQGCIADQSKTAVSTEGLRRPPPAFAGRPVFQVDCSLYSRCWLREGAASGAKRIEKDTRASTGDSSWANHSILLPKLSKRIDTNSTGPSKIITSLYKKKIWQKESLPSSR